MPLNTFPDNPLPDLPVSQDFEYLTKETDFGDGYTIVALDGINAKKSKVDLTWTNITLAEMTVLKEFLDAHVPATPFLYTAPDGIQSTYLCKSWSLRETSYRRYAVQAPLEQTHGA